LQRLDLKTPIGPVRHGHWPSHSTPHTDALHYDEASLPRGHTIGLLVENHSKSGAAVHRQSNVARGASSAVKLGGGGEEGWLGATLIVSSPGTAKLQLRTSHRQVPSWAAGDS